MKSNNGFMIPPSIATQLPDIIKRIQQKPTPFLPSLPMQGIVSPEILPNINADYTLRGEEQKKDPFALHKGLSAGIGGAALTMANQGRPDVGLGALGGAMKGAGVGAMLGPMGAGVGAIIGGLTGLATTGINRGQYEDNRTEREKGNIRAATVFGTDIGEYRTGGNVTGEEGELTPVQTEKKEKIVLPDGHIFNTKSTKLHKQMDSDEITDILPAGSYVGSNHKSQRITKSEAEKFILGYDMVTYEEKGNSSKPTERKLSDLFRKNKMTPAEILDIIKNKFPTAEVPFDPFTKKSNKLNLKARLPYINAVIAANLKDKQ